MESGGIHVQAALCSLPPRKHHTECTFPPGMKMQQHVCIVYTQGSPLDTQHLRFLLGTSHIGILCLVYTRISDSRRKARVLNISHIVCTNVLGVMNFPHQLTDDQGYSESQVSDDRQSPTLQEGLSKDNSLWAAMLTLFRTLRIYIYVYIYIYMYMYVYIYTYKYVYIYTHTYTYIYTYLYTYINFKIKTLIVTG